MAEERAVQQRPSRLNLIRRKHQKIQDLDALREAAQLAIQVEFTTIPTYLTAMYSISDRTSQAFQIVRSVVMEEMFHLNQAANILVGIGGSPVFTGEAVPVYPTYLPSSNHDTTPYIGLFQASPAVFENVFMAIETPAPFNAPAEGQSYNTIAQLYYALLDGIKNCVAKYGAEAVFKERSDARQRTDIYLGKFGGKAIHVNSVATAEAAIHEIIAQGEGAVTPYGQLVAEQPFGAYHHYGDRTDGTYGPILGVPKEASHYVKFLRVANADNFPSTYPIVSSPRNANYKNPDAAVAARQFNAAYSVMLKSLDQTFKACKDGADPFFQTTLRLMHETMADIAYVLMTTPIMPDGNKSVGPNACPTFEYDAGATLASILSSIDASLAPQAPRAAAAEAPQGLSAEKRHLLEKLRAKFQELNDRSQKAGLGF